jgi:CheY-like chemotaxis protein
MATILIVEDQEQILILAQSFLEEQGHKTLSAATVVNAGAKMHRLAGAKVHQRSW